MWLNPIVKKDVKVQSRSMKICWGVFAYEIILALTFFFAMILIRQQNLNSTDNIYSVMVWLYPVLAITQLVVLGMVVPVRTAASISGEKERQTFDIMMTTSMTPFSIVWGKVMTAVVQSMLFVVASMPIMALPFIIGGMSWSYLFWFLAIAFLVSFFAASIGILCSSICKKSVGAVVMSYAIYLVFFIGTGIPYLVYQIVSVSTNYTAGRGGDDLILFLLVNPAVYLLEFVAWVMVGESIMNTFWSPSGWGAPGVQNQGLIYHVATGHRWIILSTVLLLAISFLFLWLASKRINPIRRHRKKRG